MTQRRPDWIKAKAPQGENYVEVKRLVESAKLHTVCQSANCPNIGECWHSRTATFMILGNTCTRNCRFCAVNHGKPDRVDEDEPRRVADAVTHLKLHHAVITSVTRDDLADGGAHIFAETIRLIHQSLDKCSVEVLIPDLQGDDAALKVVLDANPEILNHNVETVERCYPSVRPQAIYSRSLEVIRHAKRMAPLVHTKSGIMVGAGEQWDEIVQTMRDLRSAQCDILTIGQYLAPSGGHVPISRYYTPEEFSELERIGLDMGFAHVESGPLVRSSYHADRQI
ncbi:MAG: lipoyl synthase [Armatimonadota bacterium]|nr:lipoyl synthase [bacterium]